ncbi:MAG: LytTR family DNA-binding domain-containing protein [Bacteroidales bacterium]|jgi:DNA-binding LytR/AlgR family response regulator|nr:LytTR family DNA-binding domain-containing protein [Bacteroidales bacterium]
MIRCIAIDDNAHDLEIIENNIAKVPFLELLKTFDNAFNAIEFIDKEEVDLIFTDVEMPVLTGLEFLGSLRHRPHSIIVSEQERYAVDAFNLEAVDYLLKPFSFERFLKAVNKVREQIRLHVPAHMPAQSETQNRDFIFIKSDYKTIRISVDDVLFIEGLKDYVKLHTTDKPVLSLLSLRALELGLPADRFIRVHRSYIVALNKIDIIEKSRIRIGQHSITISDMYRDAFLKKIQPLK